MFKPHVHIPYGRITEHLPLLRANRLNLEIYFPSSSLDTVKSCDIAGLAGMLDYQPSISIHAPFMDLSPGAVDSKVRAVTIERFQQVFHISASLRPKIIVFHSGFEKWKYSLNVDIWLEESLRTWRQLLPAAEKTGTKIAIENIFEDEPSSLKLLMQEMDSDSFGVCFDAGHCNLFSTVPLAAWINQLKPYIIELHLHDNSREADAHKPVGEGTFDFDTLFSMLKDKDLLYTIEAHSAGDVLKNIEALKKYL